MNIETKFVIKHFNRNLLLILDMKKLITQDAIRYMKRNLDLKDDTELTQIQCNLFYSAMSDVNWNEVIIELEI